MLDLVIATRNRHKVRELRQLLPVPGIRWRSLLEFPHAPEIRETGTTFEANAIKKARAIARATGCLALADDSGIQVKALGGRPGVRSARFAGTHGDDAANNAKLLRLLETVPPAHRGARYRCCLALAAPQGQMTLAHGTWRGRIAETPRGRGGFGYDPIFLVPRVNKTVGQLSARMKHALSHRAIAARRLQPALQRAVWQAAHVRRRGRPVTAT